MAGLLDIFGGGDTPESQAQTAMYLGLLGATTPRGQRTRLGPAFAQAGQQYMGTLNAAKQQALKDKLLNAQLSDREDSLQLKKDSAAAKQLEQAQRNAFMGIGQPPDAGYIGAQGQQQANGQPTAQSLAAQYGIPRDAIVSDYLYNNGKDIGSMIMKAGGPDKQIVDGYLVDKNKLGSGFLPGSYTGADGKSNLRRIGPDGLPIYSAPSGAMETYAAYKRIDEATKAGYDMAAPYTRPDGTTIMQTRAQQVREATGGLAPAEQGDYANERQMKKTVSGNMGRDPLAIPREIRNTQQELMLPLDPKSKALLQAYLDDLLKQSKNTPMPRGGGIFVQSEPDRLRAAEQVKANITPDSSKVNALLESQNALSVLDKALNHPGLSAGTGLSSLIDPRNYIYGTDATNFDSLIKQIKGKTFMQAFQNLKSGGAISEKEGEKATAAIARLETSQSTPEFKESLKELTDIIRRGSNKAQNDLSGGSSNFVPQIGATGSFEEPSEPNTMPEGFKVIR
jgi:hypothetical protein